MGATMSAHDDGTETRTGRTFRLVLPRRKINPSKALRTLRQSTDMATLGGSLSIKGSLRAQEDLTLECRVAGPIRCEDGAVVIGASGDVSGDILARDITIHGRFSGQLIATEVVDIRAEASVTGQIVSRRLILAEGAFFKGRVEPQHLEAALRIAEFEQRKQTAAR